MTTAQRNEIKAAIQWYETRGKDWGDIVCYLTLKFTDRLEPYMRPHCFRTNYGWKRA